MKIEIKTEASLIVGQKYYVLIINYSIGGRLNNSQPHCFPKMLRYDGNDENKIPIFSEEYFTITKEVSSLSFHNGQWRKYNDENFIVIGILPASIISEKEMSSYNWKKILNIEEVHIERED